ncbi:hypothetical protein [Nocardia abscessus]|uniref:hypothetical protein n=1 Tax=Nocardia abscessus TaxID=120957 RepID=UPI0024547C0E|nr:hypothetical protein [Nocardia abscessus]
MKRLAQSLLVIGIAAAGIGFTAGAASAGETGAIIGLRQCEEVAKQYKAMGYSARCNHIHGDRYYVYYEKSNRPSTGSFGS